MPGFQIVGGLTLYRTSCWLRAVISALRALDGNLIKLTPILQGCKVSLTSKPMRFVSIPSSPALCLAADLWCPAAAVSLCAAGSNSSATPTASPACSSPSTVPDCRGKRVRYGHYLQQSAQGPEADVAVGRSAGCVVLAAKAPRPTSRPRLAASKPS